MPGAGTELDAIALGVVVFTVLHAVCPALTVGLLYVFHPGLAVELERAWPRLSATKQAAFRRLVRGWVYYSAAAPFGCLLLLRVRSATDLMFDYDGYHRFGFAMAASHWIITIFEDVRVSWSAMHSHNAEDGKLMKGASELAQAQALARNSITPTAVSAAAPAAGPTRPDGAAPPRSISPAAIHPAGKTGDSGGDGTITRSEAKEDAAAAHSGVPGLASNAADGAQTAAAVPSSSSASSPSGEENQQKQPPGFGQQKNVDNPLASNIEMTLLQCCSGCEFKLSHLMLFGYLFHHALAVVAYVTAMLTHEVTGMCSFGLLFELPVIFSHFREFAVLLDDDLRLVRRLGRRFWYNWAAITVGCVVGRSLPIVIWILSLFLPVGQDAIAALSRWPRQCYYLCGALFMCLSGYYMLFLLMQCDKDCQTFSLPRRLPPAPTAPSRPPSCVAATVLGAPESAPPSRTFDSEQRPDQPAEQLVQKQAEHPLHWPCAWIVARLSWALPAATVVVALSVHCAGPNFRAFPNFISECDVAGSSEQAVFTPGLFLSGALLSRAAYQLWAFQHPTVRHPSDKSVFSVATGAGVLSGMFLSLVSVYDIYDNLLTHLVLVGCLLACGLVWAFGVHIVLSAPRRFLGEAWPEPAYTTIGAPRNIITTRWLVQCALLTLGTTSCATMAVSFLATLVCCAPVSAEAAFLDSVQDYINFAGAAEYGWVVSVLGMVCCFEAEIAAPPHATAAIGAAYCASALPA